MTTHEFFSAEPGERTELQANDAHSYRPGSFPDFSSLFQSEQRVDDEARQRLWLPPPLLPEQIVGNPPFIAASVTMRHLLRRINQARASHSPVLITGETGTGKELLARYVHQVSERDQHKLVIFNCAGLVREIAESQLFGHRRGSFTGAINDQSGLIRAADGGTLFLDEIGELGQELQPKLLRFLQEGEVLPLGATEPVKVNVRLLTATNRDLEAEVKIGSFRADLFYRLNAIRLHLPPLRERREEIPLLIAYYLRWYGAQAGRDDWQLSRETADALRSYDWPGNVRELCYEMERLVLFAEPGAMINPQDLSPMIAPCHFTATPDAALMLNDDLTMAETLARLERRLIERALTRHEGNLSRTTKALGMTRTGLRKAIARLAISREEWRATELELRRLKNVVTE